MDNCIFIGRTTRDIELKQTPNGKNYAKFTLAVDTGYGENRKANFFNMIAWNKSAEALEKFVPKGTKIAVECEAHQDVFNDQNGNKINTVTFQVKSWEFAQSKGEMQQDQEQPKEQKPKHKKSPAKPKPQPAPEPAPPTFDFADIPDNFDDELPFA